MHPSKNGGEKIMKLITILTIIAIVSFVALIVSVVGEVCFDNVFCGLALLYGAFYFIGVTFAMFAVVAFVTDCAVASAILGIFAIYCIIAQFMSNKDICC